MYTLNFFKNVKKPEITTNITVQEWFNQIKHSEFSEIITLVREGTIDKDTAKSLLPAVTYNFNFKGRKENKNIISSTGLLYIDIDCKEGEPEFNLNLLDFTNVFAAYKSIGGKGFSIIVKVEGLTLSNFKDTYHYIANQLGVSEYIDYNAAKATQYNVLSFDEDLYINYDSPSFKALNVDDKNSFAPTSVVIYKKKEAYTYDVGARNYIRFDNKDEIEINGEYIVNWEGYDYIKCFLLLNKRKEDRNKALLAYTNNLVWLNPQLNFKAVLSIVRNVNQSPAFLPVEDSQIIRVVKSIFKYKEEGSLKPIYFSKKAKIVFNKGLKLSKEEKNGIVIRELANKKRSDSKDRIKDIIEKWDFNRNGKITQRSIVKNYNVAKNTVEKYYKLFKVQIDELNNKNTTKNQIKKSDMKVIKKQEEPTVQNQNDNYEYDEALDAMFLFNHDLVLLNFKSFKSTLANANKNAKADLVNELKRTTEDRTIQFWIGGNRHYIKVEVKPEGKLCQYIN